VVSFAYDAQGEEVLRKDQAGNIVETDFDGSGRLTQKRVTTLAGGFDGAIRRIATAYDGLGRRQTVTQYDNAAVGSGTVQDEVKLTYDGWGNLEKLEQDRNSAVGAEGSVDDYEVSYTYAKATAGRNTVRRTGITLPSSASVSYDYRSVAGRHDDDVSRVTTLTTGAVVVASYQYNGLGQVVEQDYNEIEVMWRQFGSTSGEYPDLDRFNRVTSSRWTKDLATDVDFYDVDITYDRNSNITLVEDNVHSGFDVSYSIDDIDRLTRAEEGTWNGSSITSRARDQQWTLDQAGNWDEDKLDLNGDLNYTDTDEWDDCRTHNDVNELTARDLDCTPGTGGDNYALSYDAAGNMTDDAKDYKYEYDAFNRLRQVKNQSDALVEENRYNGLGFRIAEHVDTDDDQDVDANDSWRYFAYDERWRVVAHFLNSDTAPTEEFLNHNAGLDGLGGSSYIDLVVMRERDTDDNGSLNERLYYCQNWRADVSALIERLAGPSTQLTEWAKYSAYGVPFGLPGGDTDSDGDCDATDVTQIQTWIDLGPYNVRGDIDLDGDVDATDKSTVQNNFQGTTLGRGNLSAVVSRRGYAGYEFDLTATDKYHIRNRVLSPVLGRWVRRDPIGYADLQQSLYHYGISNPLPAHDPLGLRTQVPGPTLGDGDCKVYKSTEHGSTTPCWILRGGAVCNSLFNGRCGQVATEHCGANCYLGADIEPQLLNGVPAHPECASEYRTDPDGCGKWHQGGACNGKVIWTEKSDDDPTKKFAATSVEKFPFSWYDDCGVTHTKTYTAWAADGSQDHVWITVTYGCTECPGGLSG